MLCAAERERYRRLLFDRDRRLFLVAHALVRRVLSRYAAVDPSAWRFSTGKHGRPEIAAPRLPATLRFNLSHTEGLAACVVTLESACGIDVEKIVERPRMMDIAARVFAGPEQQELHRLTGTPACRERFFAYWTLREAWCKARGTGLAQADRSVWFEPGPDAAVRMHGLAGREATAGWQAVLLRPATGYMLALALRDTGATGKAVVCRFIEP
ncbi:MAG: 4'-phosphopantetheinyl transferase superfamily protein [Gammaproteobacteria bacterium]|jgi:4'-phosphopantetheinyl transferase